MLQESKLKVIPLGGLDEIGKNMTAIEYDDEIIVIDAGSAFPDADMHGVNVIVPDITYLKENKNKVKKLFITHGHEDHIGGIAYFLREFEVDVYATKLTTALIRNKLKGQSNSLKLLNIIDKDSVIKGENIEVSFFETNHSIPDSVGIVLKTPLGTIVHTSDFKVELSPVDGKMLDYSRIGGIAKEGVLLLLSDSTNALKVGFSPSEGTVAENLFKIISQIKGRVIATTFASSLYRIQSLIRVAEKENRKICLIGTSMVENVKTAVRLGYLIVENDTIISEKEIDKYKPNQILIITTGSQGESKSALRRMVEGKSKFKLNSSDTVLFSSHTIPGNEVAVNYLFNELSKAGVTVHAGGDIHASGHGYREELKLMLRLFNPKYFMPVHGEYRMLKTHVDLAEKAGVNKENCFILFNGDVLSVTENKIGMDEKVKGGMVLVDQSGLGDVEYGLLKDRERLANHGVAFIQVRKMQKKYWTRVILKGVVAAYDRKELYREVRETIEEIMQKNENNKHSWKKEIYREVGDVLEKHLNRKPLIIPIFD